MNYDVDALIAKMAIDINHDLSVNTDDINIIGIQTGGLLVAEKLAQALGHNQAIGKLNITFYRDDFTKLGLHPEVHPSDLPFLVDNKTIILVDDVLHTGRTIRAALNEIFDYGRPARIILAILINRGDNELPISPDFCAIYLKLRSSQEIRLNTNDNKLGLHILDR